MSIIGKIKKQIWMLLMDEQGDISIFTIVFILAVNLLLATLLMFASVKITCMNIRNAAKMELNNVSARIYDDTFHSQREANLTSYMGDLNIYAGYQRALTNDFIVNFENRTAIQGANYILDNISLSFQPADGKIEYIFHCDVLFELSALGDVLPKIKQSIQLIGSHRTKYN